VTRFIAVLQERLTLRDILADIPRDLEAILVYLMFAGIVWFIWWGSRERGGGGTGSGTAPPPDASKPVTRPQQGSRRQGL
jgi:hypothetical protein